MAEDPSDVSVTSGGNVAFEKAQIEQIQSNFPLVLHPYEDVQYFQDLEKCVRSDEEDFKRIVHAHLLSNGAMVGGWDFKQLKTAVKDTYGFEENKDVDKFVEVHFKFKTFREFIKNEGKVASVTADDHIMPFLDASNKDIFDDAVASVKNKDEKERKKDDQIARTLEDPDHVEESYRGVNRLRLAIDSAYKNYRDREGALARIDAMNGTDEKVFGINYNFVCTEFAKIHGVELTQEYCKTICGRSTLMKGLMQGKPECLVTTIAMQNLLTKDLKVGEKPGMYIALKKDSKEFTEAEIKAAKEECQQRHAQVSQKNQWRENRGRGDYDRGPRDSRPPRQTAPAPSAPPSAPRPRSPNDSDSSGRLDDIARQVPSASNLRSTMPAAPVDSDDEGHTGDYSDDGYGEDDDAQPSSAALPSRRPAPPAPPAEHKPPAAPTHSSSLPRRPSVSAEDEAAASQTIAARNAAAPMQQQSRAGGRQDVYRRNHWEEDDESPSAEHHRQPLQQSQSQMQQQPATSASAPSTQPESVFAPRVIPPEAYQQPQQQQQQGQQQPQFSPPPMHYDGSQMVPPTPMGQGMGPGMGPPMGPGMDPGMGPGMQAPMQQYVYPGQPVYPPPQQMQPFPQQGPYAQAPFTGATSPPPHLQQQPPPGQYYQGWQCPPQAWQMQPPGGPYPAPYPYQPQGAPYSYGPPPNTQGYPTTLHGAQSPVTVAVFTSPPAQGYPPQYPPQPSAPQGGGYPGGPPPPQAAPFPTHGAPRRNPEYDDPAPYRRPGHDGEPHYETPMSTRPRDPRGSPPMDPHFGRGGGSHYARPHQHQPTQREVYGQREARDYSPPPRDHRAPHYPPHSSHSQLDARRRGEGRDDGFRHDLPQRNHHGFPSTIHSHSSAFHQPQSQPVRAMEPDRRFREHYGGGGGVHQERRPELPLGRPQGASTPIDRSRDPGNGRDLWKMKMNKINTPKRKIRWQILIILKCNRDKNKARRAMGSHEFGLIEEDVLNELVEMGCGNEMDLYHATIGDRDKTFHDFLRQMDRDGLVRLYKGKGRTGRNHDLRDIVYVLDPFIEPPPHMCLKRC